LEKNIAINSWLTLAIARSVVTRASWTALVVGSLLILINYGELIFMGNLHDIPLLKVALTYCVPYGVSTFSAVEAMRSKQSG
jgi:hypothetical protein